jgi:hypothetical protein
VRVLTSKEQTPVTSAETRPHDQAKATQTVPLSPTAGEAARTQKPRGRWFGAFQHSGARLTLGVAAAAAILAIAAGNGSLQSNTAPPNDNIPRATLAASPGVFREPPLKFPRPPWMAALLRDVTMGWNEKMHTDKDGHAFPPGKAVTGFILEERNATTGVYTGTDIGRAQCLDNGVDASCTYTIRGVMPGVHLWRLRAYADTTSGREISAPSVTLLEYVTPKQ